MWEVDEQKWDSWADATFLLVRDSEKIDDIAEHLKSYLSVQNAARDDWKITGFIVKTLKDVAEEIKYNPFISDYFHTSDGSYKVLGAEFVYAEYRPDGSYSLHAINPIIEPFKMGEYNPI